MDTQAPPSNDGIHGLVDLTAPSYAAPARAAEPPPVPAPAAPPAGAPAKGPAGAGLFGRFLRGNKAVEAAPAPATATAAAAPGPAPADGAKGADGPAAPAGPKLAFKKKRKRSWRYEAPAWAVSALVHVGLLGFLGLVAVTAEVANKPPAIDSAPFDPKVAGEQANELVHIYADPSAAPRDQAVGGPSTATPGGAAGLGTGTGPPSATPGVRVASAVGEGNLPQVKVVAKLSGLSLLPTSSASKDFSLRPGGGGGAGGGGLAGDVTAGTKDIGEALDQLAREILRHLNANKLTVIWLFDESGSMKDDQRAVKDKFGRVSRELKLNLGDDKKAQNALNHVVLGFGDGLHPEVEKPTANIETIGKAIDNLFVDQTGTERTCEAIARVVNNYGKQIKDGRRMLLVLVTDESGDDGENVEEARQALVSYGVPLYVIGRQSLFGYERAHLLYIDPVTKEHYWPSIRRGPESADRECLQIDGLHERWDEQPSGFAPYELARLARDSGGIYFLLPSEENMRVRKREKAYSIAALKEYVPSYDNRVAYMARRDKSDLGRLLSEIIQFTSKDFVHRRHYPINPPDCMKALEEEYPKVEARLQKYLEIEKRLRAAQKLREREPDKRWQAHYDLMLAQVVTYQVKAYEYRACMKEMDSLLRKNQLRPGKMPEPGKREVLWVIDHSGDRKAPKEETEKKYAEARKLLDQVIKNHPKTPWADLAQDEINHGFGCKRGEEHHGPGYNERAKLVPKY